MMKDTAMKRLDPRILGEWLLVLATLASVGWIANFFLVHRYLPQPFVYDTNDTFMDWFNTAEYAHRPGGYDVWHSVYLPLSFLSLKFFTLGECYLEPFYARNCDWLGKSTIIALYAIDCIVAFTVLRRADNDTAIPRAIAFSLGFPLLFCLERGNLILACLPAFMFAYSGLVRSRFGRALSIAVTINFKQYLVISSFGLMVKRDWRTLELAAFSTVAVYLLSYACLGSGDPFQIIENMHIYNRLVSNQFFSYSYYSTSYSTLQAVRDDNLFSVLEFMPSRLLDAILFSIPLAIHSTQAIGATAIVAAWLQPESVSLPRTTTLFTSVYMVTQSPTGYALAFITFLIFLERGRRVGQSIALLCAYLQSLSFDVPLATVFDTDQTSWLSGSASHTSFGLALGQLVRPGLLIVTVWALAFDTITQSIVAHHQRRPSLGLMPFDEGRARSLS